MASVQKTKELGPLHRIEWLRVVVDECHVMKNITNQTFWALFLLKAERRWCLNRTPIPKEVFHLFPYFSFLPGQCD